jgi:biotin carboxyl carrier protein
MKMEIEVKSPKDGVVSKIVVNQGDAILDGQSLMFIE